MRRWLGRRQDPALTRLVCLEGADQDSYQQARTSERDRPHSHLARQIQRLVQQVGAAAQTWQEREALKPLPDAKPVPIFLHIGLSCRQDSTRSSLSRNPFATTPN